MVNDAKPVQHHRPLQAADLLWFDPAVLTAATYPQQTDVPLLGSVVQQLIGQNPRRWGLYIVTPHVLTPCAIGPFTDLDSFTWTTLVTASSAFKVMLFADGPIVTSAWFALPGSAITLRVIELLRL